jgi:hypothetical protein
MLFFWVVTLCGLVGFGEKYIFRAEWPADGDSMFLRNVGVHLRVHILPEPRITTSIAYYF